MASAILTVGMIESLRIADIRTQQRMGQANKTTDRLSHILHYGPQPELRGKSTHPEVRVQVQPDRPVPKKGKAFPKISLCLPHPPTNPTNI